MYKLLCLAGCRSLAQTLATGLQTPSRFV